MADDRARAHKEEGNRLFNLGNFERAVVEYSKGIKQEPEDILLKTVLFSNRATALYKLGRYEESAEDAIASRRLTPTHVKALYRGALCFLQLEKYVACVIWCLEGLRVDNQCSLFRRVHKEAIVKQIRAQAFLEGLKGALRGRGINIQEGSFTTYSIRTTYGDTSAKVQMTDSGKIIWPVLLLYPEYRRSDFIAEFHENSSLHEHFLVIFSEPAPWDTGRSYTPDNLKAYFCNEDESITPVDVNSSLLNVMRHRRFKVTCGRLEFYITSREYDRKLAPLYQIDNCFIY